MVCLSIGSAVFAGLTIVADRPRDRPCCYSASNNRPHLRNTIEFVLPSAHLNGKSIGSAVLAQLTAERHTVSQKTSHR